MDTSSSNTKNNPESVSNELISIIENAKSKSKNTSLRSNSKALLKNSKNLIIKSRLLARSTNDYSQIEMYLKSIGEAYNYCIIFKTFQELQVIIDLFDKSKTLLRRLTSKVTHKAKSLSATLKRNNSLKPCNKSIIDYNIWRNVGNENVEEQQKLVKRFNTYLNDTKCFENICDGKKILIILNPHLLELKQAKINKLLNQELSLLISPLLIGNINIVQIYEALSRTRTEPLIFTKRSRPNVAPSKLVSIYINSKNNKNLIELDSVEYFKQIKEAYKNAVIELGNGSIYDDIIYKKHFGRFENTYRKKLIEYNSVYNCKKFCFSLIAFLDNLFSNHGGKKEGQRLMDSLITSDQDLRLEKLSQPTSNGTSLVVPERQKTSRVASQV